MPNELDIKLLSSPRKVTITTSRKAPVDTLQGTWDLSTDPEKNTFVDANDTEILTFMDSFTWDQLVTQQGRGYVWAHPAQTTGFRTGDAVDIEATIFQPLRAANALKAINTLATHTTLNNTNSFGNLDRFTDTLGVQLYGVGNAALTNYVVDNFTSIGIFMQTTQETWNDAIDNALASTQHTFSNWFIPSSPQVMSVVQNEEYWYNFAPFNALDYFKGNYWTSTTRYDTTTHGVMIGTVHNVSSSIKSGAGARSILYRKHF